MSETSVSIPVSSAEEGRKLAEALAAVRALNVGSRRAEFLDAVENLVRAALPPAAPRDDRLWFALLNGTRFALWALSSTFYPSNQTARSDPRSRRAGAPPRAKGRRVPEEAP